MTTTISDEQLMLTLDIEEALEQGDSEALFRHAATVRKQGNEEYAHALYLSAKRYAKADYKETMAYDEFIGN